MSTKECELQLNQLIIDWDEDKATRLNATDIEAIKQLQQENQQLRDNWNELKKWIKKRIENANKYLNDKNNNWDEDSRGYVLARKFQLEEILSKYKEIIGGVE